MSDIENRIREAYDSVSMPEGLKQKTLTYIYEQEGRSKQEERYKQEGLSKQEGRTIRKKRSSKAFGLALAACVVLLLIGFGGFKLYTTETAFVEIEVNPTLEFGLNAFDIVVSTHALNDDAQHVLDGLSLQGMSYDDAMAALFSNDRFMAYITEDSFMDINISCNDQRQSQNLQSASDARLGMLPCEGVCHQATSELRSEAHGEHMGVGRYQAALMLIELDDTVTLDMCKDMSMKELREKIIAAGGEVTTGSHNGHQGQSRGHGQNEGNHGDTS